MVFGNPRNWVQGTRPTPQRWAGLSSDYPSPVLFWLRTSPGEMQPLEEPVVDVVDPPLTYSNMRLVVLDSRGRLLEFQWMPPQIERTGGSQTDVNAPSPWPTLFDAAGLDMTAFIPATSLWTPASYADTRLAWEGPGPDGGEARLRVEGASLRGRPVLFQVVGPWTSARRESQRRLGRDDAMLVGIALGVLVLFIVAAAALARRHLRSGRADLPGATKLAFMLGVPMLAAWALQAHHVWALDAELRSLVRQAARVALLSGLMWTIYVALEPYVRRFWPHGLLGWSRVLAGHFRDSRVGSDVLVGVLFGVVLALSDFVRATLFPWLGYPAPRPPFGTDVQVFSGAGPLIARWLTSATEAVQFALLSILIVVVLRLLLRWSWLALTVTALLLGVSSWQFMGSSSGWLWAFPIVPGALLTLAAVRFGLLTLVVAWFVWSTLYYVPLTGDLSHWSATPAIWTFALLAGLAAFGFYASRAGQPLFGQILRH